MEATDNSRDARALYDLALEKMRRNHLDDALRDLDRAIRLHPSKPLYVSQYGLCLCQRGDVDRAIEICESAAKAGSRDPLVLVNLGRVYRAVGDASSAHAVFVKAWKADRPNRAVAAELARMGVRRPPVVRFLPRSHWCNRGLGRLRYRLERAVRPPVLASRSQ
jgi:Flp pilus assembly protein TadD